MRLKLDKYIKRIDPRGLLDEGSRNNDYNVEKSVESAKVKQRAECRNMDGGEGTGNRKHHPFQREFFRRSVEPGERQSPRPGLM